jgi:photosystem II stability/assembly factor-like uncharacterized protein
MRSKESRVTTMKIRIAVSIVLFAATSFLQNAVFAGNEFREDLFSISFPTDEKGWSCGNRGTVIHTSDGGKSWSRQKSGTDHTLSSIYFVDTNNGWVVGEVGTILHTSDGGKNWRAQESPVPYFLMDVWFADAKNGWIVTERTTILHTRDGGETWGIQFSDEDFILKAISFADADNGWAAGEFGYIYHTVDGGRTWEHQAGMFDLSEETGEIVGGNFLFDVAAVSPQEAWVVGIDGYVAHTIDGGKNWRTVRGAPQTHLFGVSADRTGRIIVAGDAVLVETTDGGATWREVTTVPSIRYGWLYKLSPRGSAGFAAVGMNGWIYVDAPGEDIWRRYERK